MALTRYSLQLVQQAPPEKQTAKLHRLYEAVEALPLASELLESTGAEALAQLLNVGDIYAGEDFIGFVPAQVTPSQRVWVCGNSTDAYSTFVDACFERGCHKVTLQTVSPIPESFDMRLVGTLQAEAWTKDKWVDILLYEKVSPAWTESIGEAVTPKPKKARKRSNARRNDAAVCAN